jgi:uncharacterized protein
VTTDAQDQVSTQSITSGGPTKPAKNLPNTPLGKMLEERHSEVATCLAKYEATNAVVFGSVARGEDHQDSDIDIAIDIAPGHGLIAFISLQEELSEILGRPVDLVTHTQLRPRVRDSVERDAIAL